MNKFLPLAFSSLVLLAGCYQSEQPNARRTTAAPTPTNSAGAPTPAGSNQAAQTSGKPDFARALSDYRAENLSAAENGFREVVKAEPNNAEAHFYLGKINADRRDYSAALPHFEQAAKIDFKSPEKLMALGDAQREAKQFDRAVVQYQKVIGFEPNRAQAYYGLGLTYVGLKNPIAARQQLAKLEPLDKSLAGKLKQEIEK